MSRSSWIIGCLVALATPSLAAPSLDLSRPLPVSSALPRLHTDWTMTSIAGLGPDTDVADAQSILLAHPAGRQALIALDPRTGYSAWPGGRELDDRDGSHTTSAVVGDKVIYFDRAGDVGIARVSDGSQLFTIRGTRCERGKIAGSGDRKSVV